MYDSDDFNDVCFLISGTLQDLKRKQEVSFLLLLLLLLRLLLLLPLTLQPSVGFGLSNNVLPFFPVYHQLISCFIQSKVLKYFKCYFKFWSYSGQVMQWTDHTLSILMKCLSPPPIHTHKQQTNSVASVRTRTIPTERPPPVGEVSANFCG